MKKFDEYLDKAFVELSLYEPFYAHILYGVNIHLVNKNTSPHKTAHVTAFTDCLKNIWFYEEFVEILTYPQFVFVLKHECDHIIRLTGTRRETRDPENWNVATDYAINNDMKELQDQDRFFYGYYEVLKGALVSKEFSGMTSEEIYDKLPDDAAEKLAKKGAFSDDTVEPGEECDCEAAEAEVMERVLEAADKIGDEYGNLSAGHKRAIEEYRKAKMDWRAYLSEFVSAFPTDYDFTRRDRRYDVFIPDIGGEQIEIAVGVDMSGSITQQMAKDFLSEVFGILTAYGKVKLMAFTFDTDILVTAEIENEYDLVDFGRKMKGGGGTSFVRPILKVQKRTEIKALVMFTDGAGQFPPKEKVTIPILWILTKDGSIKEGYGKWAYLD